MKDQVLLKSIINYLILSSITFFIIILFVFIFYFLEKKHETEIISANVRNNLLIGDHRSVYQSLINTFINSDTSVVINDAKNELILKANKESKKGFFPVFEIINLIKTNDSTVYKIKFYYPINNPIKNSILIWLLVSTISVPYIFVERARIQEKLLKESDNAKRLQELKWLQLSRKMFHDIRSPLSSLNSLSSELKFDSQKEKMLFASAITRINEIANSLLTSTRGELIELPEFLPLWTILHELMEEKRREHSQISLLTLGTPDDVAVLIVPREFKRLLSNLINNAVEASAPDCKIEIRVSSQDDFALIDIVDFGHGIPPEVLAKLGTEEISSKKQGNGIGFKDASETLQEWGGSLSILETGHQGTTMRLHLKAKIEPKTYYLIDDDPLVRLTWETFANKRGIKLNIFESAELFFMALNSISKNAMIYIDSELGSTKGEEVALQLNNEGFKNLHITSGHPPEHFKSLTFLKTVISKSPPF